MNAIHYEIDKAPKNCGECPYMSNNECGKDWCNITFLDIDDYKFKNKDCPIKEVK